MPSDQLFDKQAFRNTMLFFPVSLNLYYMNYIFLPCKKTENTINTKKE